MQTQLSSTGITIYATRRELTSIQNEIRTFKNYYQDILNAYPSLDIVLEQISRINMGLW